MPVNLGYRHSFTGNAGALFAEAGPYIGFALAGDTEVEGVPSGDTKTDMKFGDGITETNPLDWGFNFGAGYETPWGIYVKGSYGLGLGNVPKSDRKFN